MNIDNVLCKEDYEEKIRESRDERMEWWRDGRFGMFIHYGLYSKLMTHEWSMAYGNYSKEEYYELTEGMEFDVTAPRRWVKLAKSAGMKYVVFTARHHEGFSLWDSKVNSFNSLNYGPKCDIVQYFVEACREEGLKVGIYFSLMDWYHPDGWKCAVNTPARLRFTNYLQGMLWELMSQYGTIDLLWYDEPRPMETAEGWDSLTMNQMVRRLQPNIIINNRSLLEEDYTTPEEKIQKAHYDWEACMTFNGLSWGNLDSQACMPYSYNAHQILRMLCKATAEGGNLILNIGPKEDGSIPEEAMEPLIQVGRWLSLNGKAVYGKKKETQVYRTNGLCSATEEEKSFYIWNWIWPQNGELRLGGILSDVKSIEELSSGKQIEFIQNDRCVILKGLPEKSYNKELQITIFKITFDHIPQYARAYMYPQLHRGKEYSRDKETKTNL